MEESNEIADETICFDTDEYRQVLEDIDSINDILPIATQEATTPTTPTNSSESTGLKKQTSESSEDNLFAQPGKKRYKPMDPVEKKLITMMEESSKPLSAFQHYAFSLVPTFERFTTQQFAKAKCEIDRMLYEIEFDLM